MKFADYVQGPLRKSAMCKGRADLIAQVADDIPKIQEMLSTGPKKASDIQLVLGLTSDSFYRRINRMIADGTVIRTGKGEYGLMTNKNTSDIKNILVDGPKMLSQITARSKESEKTVHKRLLIRENQGIVRRIWLPNPKSGRGQPKMAVFWELV